VRPLRSTDERALRPINEAGVVHLHARVVGLRRAAVQGLSDGTALDAWVAEHLLAAMQPASREASLAAVAEVERARSDLVRQWQLRRERSAIEVDRAARQYHACEPENRLVARELERRWDEAFKAAAATRRRVCPLAAGRPHAAVGHGCGGDSGVGGRPAGGVVGRQYDPADRQRIARMLVERVTVTVDKTSQRVDVELHWVGGTSQADTLTRAVRRYDQQADYPRLVERLRALCRERWTTKTIAGQLNSEGFVPRSGHPGLPVGWSGDS